MNNKSLFQRRKFLIKPTYQLRAALTLILSVVASSIILGFVMFYPLFKELYAAVGAEGQARISATILSLNTRLLTAALILAVLVGVQAILASHRLYGPIYRFERALKEFLDGNFSNRINLRKHDELKEVEELFNRLAGCLEGARSRDLEFRTAVREQLKEVKAMLGPEENTKANGAYKIIHELITGLESDPDSVTSFRNVS
jgi:nitrogen fixation/metabolism regulation signal transduction histidine kinase